MLKQKILTILIVYISLLILKCECLHKLQNFKSSLHNKNCYTQGLFFLNSSHVFQSCGLYNKSFFHILKYTEYIRDQQASQRQDFSLQQVYRSSYPIDSKVFLQGATFFHKTNKIYILTWRQHKVYQINAQTFQIQRQIYWQKDGWGLTNNDTHMFVTDGGSKIYVVDENFKIIQLKDIYNINGKTKLYSINQLELVKQNGKQYIYANVYMERRIVKIDLEEGKVIEDYDGIKIIQNEKGIKYDQVINGIAKIPATKQFLLTGKNWGNFYKVTL